MKPKIRLILTLLIAAAVAVPSAIHAEDEQTRPGVDDETSSDITSENGNGDVGETEDPPQRPEGRPLPPGQAHSQAVREQIAEWRDAQAALREELNAALADEELTREERAAVVAEFRGKLEDLREEHLRSIPQIARQLRREEVAGRAPGPADQLMREMRDEMRAFQADIQASREILRDQLRDADAEERRRLLEEFRQQHTDRREELREQRRKLIEELREERANRRSGGDGG